MFGGGNLNPWAAQQKEKPPAEQFAPPFPGASPGPMRASDLRRSTAAPLSAVREERDRDYEREAQMGELLADVVGARILHEAVAADYTGLVERHVCPPSPSLWTLPPSPFPRGLSRHPATC